MYERTCVTLNISSTSVRLLYVGGREVKKWGSMPLPPGLVRDGLILRPKVVGAVISSLFKSTGIPKKHVITGLSGLSFIRRILNLPRLEHASLPEVLQRAARKEMLVPPEELYICGQAISRGADEVSFFVLGVPRKHVDVLVQTLGEADIPPYLVDLNPLALARVANREEAIIVNLEPDCFDIVLIADGMPAIMHTIIPRGNGATPEDNIHLLSDELLKTVEFYNNNHPQNSLSPTTSLLVTGEMSASAATQLISNEVGHPIEPLMPPLKLPHDLPAASFTTNIGLALKKMPLRPTDGKATRFRDINLNILTGKFGTGTGWLKLPHILLSLAIVAGLGLLLPMSQLRSQAGAETVRLQTELTGVNQELNQAQQSANEAKQFEDTIGKITADAERIRQGYQYILDKSGDFAPNLTLVTNALPAEASFTSVKIGQNQITVGGEADNSFSVVSYVTALEALGKFSEVRIVSINENKSTGDSKKETNSTGVTFSIAISK
jgi:Tfp pilus assembly protein PilN